MTEAVLQARDEASHKPDAAFSTSNSHQNNDVGTGDHAISVSPEQAGQTNATDIGSGNISTLQSQTTHFTNRRDVQGANVVVDTTFLGGKITNLAPLQDILSRPVQIYSGQFGPGTTGDLMSPARDFISNPLVADKIKNFAYIRFTLKIKIVINASQFQYGKYLAAWSPLRINFFEGQTKQLRNEVQHYSTYPIKGYFHPGRQDSIEMHIPFMWRNNFFDVVNDDFSDYGTLFLFPLNPVQIANPSAPTTFDLKVFAWMEDVELNVPTSRLTATSELVDGPISGPASSIGRLSDLLSHVPIIGPFAKATSIATGAVSSIARLFGYSKPPYIGATEFRRLEMFQNTATTIGVSSSQPLSIDPKCELSIDPAIAGWTRDDEMLIENIVKREYYLGTAEWNIAGGQLGPPYTNLIAEWDVSPMSSDGFNDSVDNWIHPSPSYFIGFMFDYWRGTMIYKVEVIASKYHSGALLIQYDPLVKDGTAAPINERESVILDISKTTVVEITIDFVYTKAYQTTGGFASFVPTLGQATYLPTSLSATAIGAITITELNQLVSPDSSSPAFVNVFSRMENAEFANPNGRVANLTYTSEVVMEKAHLLKSEELPSDVLEFMGERVVSLRTLLKRDNVYLSQYFPADTTNSLLLPLYPCVQGPGRSNVKEFNSYIAYLSLAFAARRGSVKHKMCINNTESTIIEAEREIMLDDNLVLQGGKDFALMTGGVVSVSSYQPSLDVTVPYYYNERFDEINRPVFIKTNGRIEQQTAPYNTLGVRFNLKCDVESNYTVKVLASAGEDFMLICFLSAPNYKL